MLAADTYENLRWTISLFFLRYPVSAQQYFSTHTKVKKIYFGNYLPSGSWYEALFLNLTLMNLKFLLTHMYYYIFIFITLWLKMYGHEKCIFLLVFLLAFWLLVISLKPLCNTFLYFSSLSSVGLLTKPRSHYFGFVAPVSIRLYTPYFFLLVASSVI